MNQWADSVNWIPPQLESINVMICYNNSQQFIINFLQQFQNTLKSIKIRYLKFEAETEVQSFLNDYHAPNLEKLIVYPVFNNISFYGNHIANLKSLYVPRYMLNYLIENWLHLGKIEKLHVEIPIDSFHLLNSIYGILNEKPHLKHLIIHPIYYTIPSCPQNSKESLIIPSQFIIQYLVKLNIRYFKKEDISNFLFSSTFPSLRYLRVHSEFDNLESITFFERHKQLVQIHLKTPYHTLDTGPSEQLSIALSQLPSLVHITLYLYCNIKISDLIPTKILVSLHNSESLDFIEIQLDNTTILHPSHPFKLISGKNRIHKYSRFEINTNNND
ncbi:hypothetical protein DLAC_03068 [Tieghemostelium lacteum]|uniref:Uncharacterized protein n=1 Tax=Tieghemostelium lacteum TaxID=361077 RepID=A0A152A2J1_TIELA|nr:hypothetical protein DLAC_03068 [Tieghemostelium lacteum]|eukprot:KYR00325.1 hypothetical protein DLAC_03068 [Tieghemostelium lacteum]